MIYHGDILSNEIFEGAWPGGKGLFQGRDRVGAGKLALPGAHGSALEASWPTPSGDSWSSATQLFFSHSNRRRVLQLSLGAGLSGSPRSNSGRAAGKIYVF